MNNLTPGLTLEECQKNFSASINGQIVEYDGNEYTALDYRMKGGKWVVDLYTTINYDQAQETVDACLVTVV